MKKKEPVSIKTLDNRSLNSIHKFIVDIYKPFFEKYGRVPNKMSLSYLRRFPKCEHLSEVVWVLTEKGPTPARYNYDEEEWSVNGFYGETLLSNKYIESHFDLMEEFEHRLNEYIWGHRPSTFEIEKILNR